MVVPPLLLSAGSPAAALPWLTTAINPAQEGADKLVPPTICHGSSPGRLYGSAIHAPVVGSATNDTSGVLRQPDDSTPAWYPGGGSKRLVPPPLPMKLPTVLE